MDADQFNALVDAIEARLHRQQHHVYIILPDTGGDVAQSLYGVPVPCKGDDYYLNGVKYVVRNVAWSHRTYEHGPNEGRLMTFGAEVTLGESL